MKQDKGDPELICHPSVLRNISVKHANRNSFSNSPDEEFLPTPNISAASVKSTLFNLRA